MTSLNIYEMYAENGNKAGFVVQRNSSPRILAQVLSIGGRESGSLEGSPPYYNNASVLANFSYAHGFTGRPVELDIRVLP
jgi:hypothetical protein